jgi:hypothetical protein
MANYRLAGTLLSSPNGRVLEERESMRRTDADFRYHPEASEDFLIETRSLPALTHSYPRRFTFYVAHPIRPILPSSFCLSSRPRRGRIRLRFRRQ